MGEQLETPVQLNFENRFHQLGESFFARVSPKPLHNARMVAHMPAR